MIAAGTFCSRATLATTEMMAGDMLLQPAWRRPQGSSRTVCDAASGYSNFTTLVASFQLEPSASRPHNPRHATATARRRGETEEEWSRAMMKDRSRLFHGFYSSEHGGLEWWNSTVKIFDLCYVYGRNLYCIVPILRGESVASSRPCYLW